MKRQEQFDPLGDLFADVGLTKTSTKPKDATAACARLDAERKEADRIARRGYDHDPSAPSHDEWLERERLREAEVDRLASADGWIPNASAIEALAHDLVRLCTEHHLNLRATPDGIFLEVTTANWCEVMNAIEEAGYSHAIDI